MRQFATFTLGRSLLGVEVLLVREINRLMDVTPVPHCPAYVRGLINLRGHVATVLDLGARVGLPAIGGAGSHQVILKTNEELAPMRAARGRQDLLTGPDTVGLIVDDVRDVVEVSPADIEPVPVGQDMAGAEYLNGIVQLQGRLLALLDLQRILKSDTGSSTCRAA